MSWQVPRHFPPAHHGGLKLPRALRGEQHVKGLLLARSDGAAVGVDGEQRQVMDDIWEDFQGGTNTLQREVLLPREA